jgi:hypothetical protein
MLARFEDRVMLTQLNATIKASSLLCQFIGVNQWIINHTTVFGNKLSTNA